MIDLLGYVAGSMVVISLLPQTIKSWKTKSTKDLSLWRYVIYSGGLILWIIYAVAIGSIPIVVMNSLSLFLALFILFLKIKFK